MSVVIITGSSGLVGSESVDFFCNKGFDVIGIDNNLRKTFFGKEASTAWVKNKEPWAAEFSNESFIDYKIDNLSEFLRRVNEQK